MEAYMNMKLSSRVIASMSLAALLFASTACKQPAGTSGPAPLTEDQKAVDAVKGKITGDILKEVRGKFTPKLENGKATVETTTSQITVPAANAFEAQLKDTGVTAEIVFEGPQGATATVTKNSSNETKYDVAGGEVDEEFTVFAKLTKKKAETKVKIGTYKIKANADLAALKTAADKLDLGKLRGEFDPKATTGIVDIPNDKTSITIPSVTGLESSITASWESDNAAINVSGGAVTHPSHTAGATVCKISLKLTKGTKSKTVHVATFKVLPKAESDNDKAVVDIESLIKKNLATVQAAFEPKLTSGKGTVGKDVSEISVPKADTFGSDLKGVTVAVGFVAPKNATSKIVPNGEKYAVTHGSADETWKVVAKLTKGDAVKTVEIGSYTVEKKDVPPAPTDKDLVDAAAKALEGAALTTLQKGIKGNDSDELSITAAGTAVTLANTVIKLTLPAAPVAANGVTAEWVSSDKAIDVATGTVKHDAKVDGVTLSVKFSKGSENKVVLVATFNVEQ